MSRRGRTLEQHEFSVESDSLLVFVPGREGLLAFGWLGLKRAVAGANRDRIVVVFEVQ
jgi:hypothetical protein